MRPGHKPDARLPSPPEDNPCPRSLPVPTEPTHPSQVTMYR